MKSITNFLRILFVISILSMGCSGNSVNPAVDKIPGEADNTEFLDSLPVIGFDGHSAVTMLGAFDLSISPSGPKAELTPMRSSTLGESYILSGAPFFTNANCFRIRNIAYDASGGIAIEFQIKHPFKKGNTSLPPSGTNRLDLDLFDVAMVISPVGSVPSDFQLTKAYSDKVLNADGYTKELTNVIGNNAALPYKICYAASNNNRFAMGTDWQTFKVIFSLTNLQFDIYLTMGYGASAKKLTRLTPTYYVPEFNRKAAWKVKVFPPTWDEGSDVEYNCVIDVYDWNQGATVAPNYPDPTHTNWISAPSNVVSVQIEIPAILNSIKSASTDDTSQNGWNDPVTYTANLSNEKMAPVGEYVGIVKVSDSRVPNSSTVGKDYLIHTPDGIQLQNYLIPEFATYQSFKARVVTIGPGYDWGKDVGSSGEDAGFDLAVDSQENIYITGYFEGSVDFDPDPDGYSVVQSKGQADAYLLKLDKLGDFKWVKTWGAGLWDEGHALAVDSDGSIYVTGYFQGTVDFDPGSITVNKTSAGGGDVFLCKYNSAGLFQWVQAWGGTDQSIWDEGHGLAIENPQEIFVTGQFRGTIDFNPGSGTDIQPGFNDGDAFVSKFDGSGNYLWAKTWGGYIWDEGHGLDLDYNNNVYITGCYGHFDCDFDPGAGTAFGEYIGGEDIYLLKLDNNGNFIWVKNWGSASGNDKGLDVTCACASAYPTVTGYFSGTVDFDPNAGSDPRTSNGLTDVFVTRLDYYGSYFSTWVWGGSGEDIGYDIAYDNDKYELLVVGSFEDLVDFNFGALEDWHQSNGGKDIFLSCMENWGCWSGSFRWAYTWGGLGIWDEGHAIDTGSYYITGKYSKSMDMNPRSDGEDWHTSNSGSNDIFLVQFDDICDYNEIEPNDVCSDATGIEERYVYYCGSVKKAADNVDYWGFNTKAYSLYVVADLINKSGKDISLTLYNEDCTVPIATSNNPGGSDESIGPLLLTTYAFYRLKVQAVDDGYMDSKSYALEGDVYW